MSTPLGSSQWMYSSGEEVTQQSLKFNDDESQYLSWTPAAAGNRKTWTWSGWVKRGNLTTTQELFGAGNGSYDSRTEIVFDTNDQISFIIDRRTIGGTYNVVRTDAVFRDVSAWYHIVCTVDTTQATSSNRVKIYINGTQLVLVETYSPPNGFPAQNLDTYVGSTSNHMMGRSNHQGALAPLDGYLSDVYFIDGQALDPTSFGQFTNGYWEKKDYAGTYGTNGFHLTFEDDVVSEGFNTVTYRGTGATQSVSGLGLEADLVWIKQRSSVEWHRLHDTVRGVSQQLYSNGTNAEATTTNNLLSVDSDGFTLGTDSAVNGSGFTYVGWCWDAGSGSPVSNTDGSITSTVKANPDYGFSIVSYSSSMTSAGSESVGHGLTSAPEIIISKSRDSSLNWVVRTNSITGSAYDYLNLNNANAKAQFSSGDGTLNLPTSSTFDINWNSSVGAGGNTIAYCFNSVAGYSSFGSYSGTGAAGNAVNCGFRPAFIMIKKTDSASDWWIFDTTRDTNNQIDSVLYANDSAAEFTDTTGIFDFEITSNGFVNNSTNSTVNGSGASYIYMAFADTREAAFWKDVSGNNNNWTPNNLDYRDSLIDSPANNFAVMNPLANELNATLSEGNLRVIGTSNEKLIFSTFGVSSGKWYFEAYIENQELRGVVGITDDKGNDGYEYGQNYAQLSTYFGFLNTSATDSGENFSRGCQDGDVISFAVDADNGQVWIKLNSAINTGSAAFATGLSTDTTYRVHYQDSYTSNTVIKFNFGQDSTFSGATTAGGNQDGNGIGDFKYAPPSGYLALCTANLPTPSIVDGSEYFNTVLYTGTGTTDQAVTGVGFQPDFTWIKSRSNAYAHWLNDAVRGAGKGLRSDATDAEYTTLPIFLSFDSDGFTVDVDAATANNTTNGSGSTFAAWNWKAGGTAVSNTDGSITSQVSANVDAGFSIVSYTGDEVDGATVGHGLSQKPDLIIIKNRTDAVNWVVMTDVIDGSEDALYLNTTGAKGDASQDVPTSSVFTVDNWGLINGSGDAHIAYCFANTEGYLKAGSYTGNGSTDGPFVYTGFRPAWVMFKNTTASDDQWTVVDNKRDIDNPTTHSLFPSGSNSEDNSIGNGFINVDFVSNGFKIRQITHMINASSENYIYLAFAENPFKYANAR